MAACSASSVQNYGDAAPEEMIAVHADVIGSLLRPPELLAAQKKLTAGALSSSHFKEIEDRAVDDAIALQDSLGLEIVTDGEMRRQSFQSQMTSAVSGFGEHNLDAFLWGDWHDEQGDYRTNEIAINWNAGLVYALAAFLPN